MGRGGSAIEEGRQIQGRGGKSFPLDDRGDHAARLVKWRGGDMGGVFGG